MIILRNKNKTERLHHGRTHCFFGSMVLDEEWKEQPACKKYTNLPDAWVFIVEITLQIL